MLFIKYTYFYKYICVFSLYDGFFFHSFDFCTSDESKSPTENLGQVLFGERIRPSGYNVSS